MQRRGEFWLPVSFEDLERAILSLPMDAKVQLYRRLNEDTREYQFKELLKTIPPRPKGLTDKKISQIVENVRRQRHDRRRR